MANEVIETEVKELPALAPPPETAGQALGRLLTPTELNAKVQIEAQKVAAEILAQVMVAQTMPRDELLCMSRMEDKAKDPEFADLAVYCKPRFDGTFDEGPSTFLASAMANVWGNLTWKPSVLGRNHATKQSDIQVEVWDKQKNNKKEPSQVIDHKWPGGKPVTDSSQLTLIENRALSMLQRNTLIDIIGRDLVQKVFEWCQATNDKEALRLEKQRDKFFNDIEKRLEVKREQILAIVGKKKVDDLTAVDIRRIQSIYLAITRREVEADEIFKGAKNLPPVTKGEEPGDEKKSKAKASKSASNAEPSDKEQSSTTSSDDSKTTKTVGKPEPTTSGGESESKPPESAITSTVESDARSSSSPDDSKVASAADTDTSKDAPKDPPKAVDKAAMRKQF